MLKPKLAPTSLNVSDKVQDLSIIHAINLERIKASQVSTVLDILDDLGKDIELKLEKIDPTGVGPTYRSRRLASLLEQVKQTSKAHFSKAKAANDKGLKGVASASAKATQNIINGSLGVSLGATLPPAATLSVLASNTLIQGEVVGEYWKTQNAQITGNFIRQMRIGITGGENLQSLIQRVRGTKAANYADGIMKVAKNKAEALVRSSVAAVNNEALIKTYQANADLFNGYQWLATLDSRTSDICKARSGLTWDMDFQPIGHGIGWTAPPAHFNCRSTVIGVLKPWADLANKPLPAVGAGTLKEELTKSLTARGLSPALISRAINKTQQSMDGFVAGDINFEDWLKGKSERFQKAILGEQKWELWNNGKIGFVDLVDQKSIPRSIEELKALVDAGKTSPLMANKAAKEAAKQQAEAAALAAKAAQKAENAAQAQIDEILAGTGGANKKKVYDKLQKDGIGGLSATQIMAKVDEGVAQINITANVAKAKKKLKEGKPLSQTEAAAWATVDDDLKAAYLATLEAESAVFKKLDDLIESAKADNEFDKLFDSEHLFLKARKAFVKANLKNQDYLVSELNVIMTETQMNFLKGLKGENAIDSLLAAKTMSKADAEKFVEQFAEIKPLSQAIVEKNIQIQKLAKEAADDFVNQQGGLKLLMLGDPDDFDFAKYALPKDIEDAFLKKGPQAAKNEISAAISSHTEDINLANKAITAAAQKQTDEATEYLTKAKEGGEGFSTHKVAYDKLSNSGALTGDVIADAAKVQAEKDAIQAAKSLAAIKTKIKQKFKNNKPLAPKEQEAFDQLSPDDQALLKEAASAGKTAKQLDDEAAAIVTQKAAQRADEGILFDDLEQIGDQDGSNVGGLFRSKIDGQKFYVKAPDTELAAKVEVLSSKLYQAAGVRVANVNFINLTGKIGRRDVSGRLGVTSQIEVIEDIDVSKMAGLSGAKDGFAADAWLANWDVVGNGGPKQLNLKKLPDGSSFRIDTGGTLFFRAQGGRKTFSATEVPELNSLRFNEFNSGSVFGDINDDQIVAGVARIVAISDDDIRRLVKDTMGDDADDLADVLIGRKNVLQRTYAKQLAKYNKKQNPSPLARVTREEEKLIEESRINGYVLPTDKGDIEDHEVRANFLKRNKKDVTQLNLRLRPAAMERLEKTLIVQKGPDALPDISFAEMNDAVVSAIRGIMSRAKSGSEFLDKDFTRAQFALGSIRDKREELEALLAKGRISQKDFENFTDQVEATENVLRDFYRNYKAGDMKLDGDDLFTKQFEKLSPIEQIPDKIKAAPTKEIKWTDKGQSKFYRSTFRDSFAEQTDQKFDGLGTVFETEIDGVRIRYFPDGQADSRAALMGRMEIEVDGASVASVQKGMDVLEKLGIEKARATALDREELYLTKIFYHFSGIKKTGSAGRSDLSALLFKEEMERIGKIGSQNQRVNELKKAASRAAEVSDITSLPLYNAAGEYQQYGHGKALQLNPAMTGRKWEKFFDDHVIYHDLEFGKGYGTQVDSFKNIIGGGGQLAATTDRMRRGIPFGEGGSEKRDTATGGAAYVFARLKRKRSIGRRTGLIWKSKRHARRLDAMSFENDFYGSQRFSTASGVRQRFSKLDDWDVSLQERAVTVEAFEAHVDNSTNEIIFKDGLSLFEDLEVFVVRSDEKDDLIAFMKEKGYKKWPDGRKLEDVIVTESEASARY